jgi:protein required for attachment to host cells
MPVTWILIADSRHARLFEKRDTTGTLHEKESFANPADSGEGDEWRTVRHGGSDDRGGSVMVHTADPQVLPVRQEDNRFARTIVGYLDQGRNERRYDSLYLIAAPAFLGLIRGNLNHEAQRMVEEELPENIAGYDVRRIERFLDSKFD